MDSQLLAGAGEVIAEVMAGHGSSMMPEETARGLVMGEALERLFYLVIHGQDPGAFRLGGGGGQDNGPIMPVDLARVEANGFGDPEPQFLHE